MYEYPYSGMATADIVAQITPELPRFAERQIATQWWVNGQHQKETTGIGLLAEESGVAERRLRAIWALETVVTDLSVADQLFLACGKRIPAELVIPAGRGKTPDKAARMMAVDEYVVEHGLDLQDSAPPVDEWWVQRRTEELIELYHERTAGARDNVVYLSARKRENARRKTRRAAAA